VFLSDLVTEHLHASAGEAEDDQTYREGVERGKRDNLARLSIDTEHERLRDIGRLQQVSASA
jgi:hypothetical protein